jgi:phosphatidylserine/phosphatidylglycerophosphate/cardiolipin synthase-like enzyme
VPIAEKAKPKPSDEAPIQKFNWWDSGFNTTDRGKTFRYDVFPVLGHGPGDMHLQRAEMGSISVSLPNFLDGRIATYFNRAVVSAQSYPRKLPLDKRMDWLANGLQEAVPEVLHESTAFDCAIYHLSDKRWILPSFEAFNGRGSLVYFYHCKAGRKNNDLKSEANAKYLANRPNISKHRRDAISKLMHDKFIVSYKDGSPAAVLAGSTNFTPEAQTTQANLLHILHSPQLAGLYAQRAQLLAANMKTSEIAKHTGWHSVDDVPGTAVRVFFTPEPGKQREFLDTVVNAVKAAKSSVLFCMFTASDPALMQAIYGLINAIEDPDKPTRSGKKRKLSDTAVTIYHRSAGKDPDTIAYAAFDEEAPRGFLPELRSIDTSSYDVSATKKNYPPIHVHHKFIVIDGDTDAPTIYTGSPNFSKAAENSNDENELEIKGNTRLAAIYVAEFMRLYNHYRARALWDRNHPPPGKKPQAKAAPSAHADLVLKRTRDAWAAKDYKKGTKEYLARTRHL